MTNTTYETALGAALKLTREEQERLIEALEDAIDVGDYLETKRAIEAGEEELIPWEQARAEIEGERERSAAD